MDPEAIAEAAEAVLGVVLEAIQKEKNCLTQLVLNVGQLVRYPLDRAV